MQSDYLEGKYPDPLSILLIRALRDRGGKYQPFRYTGSAGGKNPCIGVRLAHPNDLFLLGSIVGEVATWRWYPGRPSLDSADSAESSAVVVYWPNLPWVDVDDPEEDPE